MMITNISRRLLVAALTFSALACSQLDAMRRQLEDNHQEFVSTSDFGEHLPSEINQYILFTLYELFDQNGPEEILNLIQHARKTFRLGTQATVEMVQACLKAKKQSLMDTRNQYTQTVLHLAVRDGSLDGDLDSIRIICILAGDNFLNLVLLPDNIGHTAFYDVLWPRIHETLKVFLFVAGDKAYDLMVKENALIEAAAWTGGLETLKILLEAAGDNAYKLMIMRNAGSKYSIEQYFGQF